MKSRTLPPLRVTPALRAEAEAVLGPGESLSAFVLESVSRNVEYRKAQREFVARGLAAGDKARRTGRYVSAGAAVAALRRQVKAARD